MRKLTHSQMLGPLASCNVTGCLGNQAVPASSLKDPPENQSNWAGNIQKALGS